MPYCLSLSAALRGPNRFHVIQRDALAVPVPGLPEDRGRVLMRADRLLKPELAHDRVFVRSVLR